MHRFHLPRYLRVFFSLALLLSSFAWGSTGFAASYDVGAVYALTNQIAGNSVQVFNRAADGTLTPGGSYSTGARAQAPASALRALSSSATTIAGSSRLTRAATTFPPSP
jgi:hypothetical protein